MKNENDNVEKEVKNILSSVAKLENINNFEVSPNDRDKLRGGFLSEFFTGEVLNKDNGEKIQVAIKMALVDGFSAGVKNEDIFKTEVNFYSKIFPALDKFQKEKNVKYPFNHVPRYFVGNADSKNLFIAMENLKTEGYVLFNKKEYFDSKHLELIFKTYGKLHALSFAFKNTHEKEYQNLVSTFTTTMEKFVDSVEVLSIMTNAYSSALKNFDPITEAEILAKLKTIQNVKETINNAKTYKGNYKCFVHGDCWSNNMLFKYKESGELEDIKLIDFQLIGSSSPIYDLCHFFYCGASKIDMDKLDYYLDLYYKSFSKFARELKEDPEELYPLAALKEEWKEYGVWGILFGCQLWVVKLLDQNKIEHILNQKGLPAEKYWDLWNELIADCMEEIEFKKRSRNICLHAVEYGIV